MVGSQNPKIVSAASSVPRASVYHESSERGRVVIRVASCGSYGGCAEDTIRDRALRRCRGRGEDRTVAIVVVIEGVWVRIGT